MNRQDIITQALYHKRGRRRLLQAMVEPTRFCSRRVYCSAPCDSCGRYRADDECDDVLVGSKDCWRPSGAMLVWDEKT